MKKLLTLVVMLALSLPLAADPRTSETVSVTLVEVPVTVVDRAGNPVRGLTAANFELVDDGKKQSIAYFEALDLTKITAKPGEPINPAARRNFLILFDLANSTPATLLRARDAVKSMVESGLRPLDLAAIATFSVEGGFNLLTSFTTDKQLLIAGIDTLGNPKFFHRNDPLFLSASTTGTSPAGAGGLMGGTGRAEAARIGTEELQELNRVHDQATDDYRRGRVKTQLRTLGGFARMLDKVKGRKQLILLSEGFDARLVQGRDTSDPGAKVDSEAVISGEIWKVDSDQRFGSTEAGTEITTMADLFKRSDVVLHAMDIRGLRGSVDAKEGYQRSSNDSLFLLSNPTGGQLFKNENDLAANFQQISRQQEVIYVLGFQAKPSGKPGKFHNLKVRLNKVPGARAYHRAGYYEPSDKVLALEETLVAAEILVGDIPQSGVPLSLIAAPFPQRGAKAIVPVLIEIPGEKLVEAVSGNAVSMELFVYAFDRANTVHDFLYQKISFDLTKVGQELRSKGLKYYGALRLEPGDYAVKTLIRVHETKQNGFQRVDLTVPKFGEPAVLTPLFLEADGKWMMVKSRPRTAAEVDYPFHIAKESFTPAVRLALTPNTPRKLALFAFGIPSKGLGINAVVRIAGGGSLPAKLTLAGVAPSDASEATKLLLDFDPTGLAPGSYWLDVSVSHKEQSFERTVSVPFEVRAAGP